MSNKYNSKPGLYKRAWDKKELRALEEYRTNPQRFPEADSLAIKDKLSPAELGIGIASGIGGGALGYLLSKLLHRAPSKRTRLLYTLLGAAAGAGGSQYFLRNVEMPKLFKDSPFKGTFSDYLRLKPRLEERVLQFKKDNGEVDETPYSGKEKGPEDETWGETAKSWWTIGPAIGGTAAGGGYGLGTGNNPLNIGAAQKEQDVLNAYDAGINKTVEKATVTDPKDPFKTRPLTAQEKIDLKDELKGQFAQNAAKTIESGKITAKDGTVYDIDVDPALKGKDVLSGTTYKSEAKMPDASEKGWWTGVKRWWRGGGKTTYDNNATSNKIKHEKRNVATRTIAGSIDAVGTGALSYLLSFLGRRWRVNSKRKELSKGSQTLEEIMANKKFGVTR